MIFKGDLSKYHPADAMMFLAQAGVDGVLSVADQDCLISLTFKTGWLLDSQSAGGDLKLIRMLRHESRLNDTQIRQIQQIQRETGLSVRQILGKLNFFPLADIQASLKTAIMEVLHELFLLDQGSFNFTETQVEDDGAKIRLDIAKAALSITPRADESRDFFKSILTGERLVRLDKGGAKEEDDSAPVRLLLKLASRNLTVKELLDKVPLPTYEAIWHLRKLLAQGAICLEAPLKESALAPAPAMDPLFAAYKQALKSILGSTEILTRLEAMISFGKGYYDHMLILTARNNTLIHCKTIYMDPSTGLVQKSTKGEFGRIDQDPVFATVHRSGIAFFGKMFPSALLDPFVACLPNAECALIPVHRRPGFFIFLYVCTARNFSGLSPQHYLELLSWVVAPDTRCPAQPAEMPKQAPNDASGSPDPSALPDQSGIPPRDVENRIAKMVGRIRDLPPLPTWVSQVLQALSRPETPLEEIEALVGKDQALVTKLIQVGNSALYSGMNKVTTLRQVLTRLGLKTIRNLILAASTRSYFMNNRKGMRVWGQFLWQHAVESGLAARRVAEAVGYPDPEEAFIGGLIHDIGKLVLLMLFADAHKDILKLKKIHHMGSKSAENQVVGCDHEQIGKLLLDRWNMPASAKACAYYHHRFQDSGDYKNLVAVVAYADLLSRQYGTNPDVLLEEDQVYTDRLAAALNLGASTRETLVGAIIDDFQNAELMTE